MILRKHITRVWAVVRLTGRSFYQDNAFFLAMGLAFNLLLYFLPLMLLMISALGYTVLEHERAMVEVQSVVRQFLPHSKQAITDNLEAIISNRGLLGLTGFFFFLIFSSTLFGSVRHVLNIIFKAERRRGFFYGIGHDFLMMLMTALLLVLGIAVASLLALARAFGAEQLPMMTPVLEIILSVVGKLFAWLFLFAIFYVFYRFAPARTLHRSTLFIASFSATILFELARWAFAWYVAFARRCSGGIRRAGRFNVIFLLALLRLDDFRPRRPDRSCMRAEPLATASLKEQSSQRSRATRA